MTGADRRPGADPPGPRLGRAVCLALVALWSLGAAACGKQGPPVAPERRLPRPPSEVRASVDGATVVLTWANPSGRVDQTPLPDLAALTVHRREDSPEAPPKPALLSWGQVVGYDEIASIRLAAPAPAVIEGGVVRWVDRGPLSIGRRYTYVVVAQDAQGRRSAPSPRAPVAFLAAPAPPRDLVAEPGDGQVRLSWGPPERLIDGSPITGELRYLVLRTTADAPLTPATEPLPGRSFLDTGLVNETPYRYAVRAIRVDPAGTARSEPSAVLTAVPVDTTPPRPPTDLVAIPSPGGVRLAWKPSPDTDVASYVVYRAVGAGDFARIGTTSASGTVFVDRDAPAGAIYRYAVTAVDRARRANESRRSNEVAVSVP